MSYRCLIALAAVLAAGTSGCSSELEGDGARADDWGETRELTLLAEVDFENGSKLEFYEAFEGAVVLSGAGPVSSPPPDYDHTLKPVEIFQALAPDRQVPEALLKAQLRAVELAANAHVERDAATRDAPVRVLDLAAEASEVGTISEPLMGDDDSACPWSTFSAVKCKGAQSCLGFVDGPKGIEHDNVKYAIGMTCNYRNGHNHLSQYRTWYSWTAVGTWFVPKGGYRYTELWNSTLDFDTRVVVQQSGASPGSHLAMRSSTSPLRVGTP